MTNAWIAIVAVIVIAAVIWFFIRRSRASSPTTRAGRVSRVMPAPPVAAFEIEGTVASVSFDVPLPDGEDEVLADILVREAVEFLRERRRQASMDTITRVVALGRRGTEWHEAGSVSLERPGELPPPTQPLLLQGLAGERAFDPFESMSSLPTSAPGLQGGTGSDVLPPLAAELRIPTTLQAGLRSQGIDPERVDAATLVIGILRLTGATVTEKQADTHEALIAGNRTLIRVVPHRGTDHPELGDAEVRRFAADFASSGFERALLITEKYSPFEIYDRERRDPRARYVTRERVQHFIDALALR